MESAEHGDGALKADATFLLGPLALCRIAHLRVGRSGGEPPLTRVTRPWLLASFVGAHVEQLCRAAPPPRLMTRNAVRF